MQIEELKTICCLLGINALTAPVFDLDAIRGKK
jgi:hypothetical protein